MDGKIGKNACFIITDAIDRAYFCGDLAAEAVLIVSDAEKAYFTDMRYYESAEKKSAGDVKVYPLTGDEVEKYILQKGFRLIGVDYGKTTVKDFNKYKKLKKQLFDCSGFISEKRSVKTEKEIENIRRACEITEKAFKSALPLLKEGITEKQFKEKLVSLYLKAGAEKESFDTIVAFGEGSAIPHYQTGDVKLKKNSVILVDTGCVFNGYCSDFTRTLYFGDPDEEFLKAYQAVLNANVYAEQNIVAKMPLKKADALSRDYLKAAGYGENFTHSLGHGVGLEIHESPYLSPKSDGVIKENQVFTIEPGVYFYGRFGIRIEDTVLLKNGKVERLFTDDKKLIILNK